MRVLKTVLVGGAVLAGLVSQGYAQDTRPVPAAPDAYVRGAGLLTMSSNTENALAKFEGAFQMDVVKLGNDVRGFVAYREIGPNKRPTAIIVTKKITAAKIEGNTAKIEAEGFYNGKAACLIIEALDDTAGDWFSIRAVGCTTDEVMFEAAGGVQKGDIKVWVKPTTPPTIDFAKGQGTLLVPSNNLLTVMYNAQFRFAAEKGPKGVNGALSYVVFPPFSPNAINRPVVQVHVPAVKSLKVDGKKAVLEGPGIYNGKQVMVRVEVDDAKTPLPPTSEAPITNIADVFKIAVFNPIAATATPVNSAGGPLQTGDIVVGTRNAAATAN